MAEFRRRTGRDAGGGNDKVHLLRHRRTQPARRQCLGLPDIEPAGPHRRTLAGTRPGNLLKPFGIAPDQSQADPGCGVAGGERAAEAAGGAR